jgi:hypothetical protein
MTTNLDPAFLDIEDLICHVALGKDDIILAKLKEGLPLRPPWRETPLDQNLPAWHCLAYPISMEAFRKPMQGRSTLTTIDNSLQR